VRFAETMPMSTYLVAFVVGPFELTEPTDVDGVPLRVAAVPGKSHLTGYAIEAGSHALRFFSQYFELPYPATRSITWRSPTSPSAPWRISVA
jgi:puromycin-sensitive aminopeptidase